MDSYYVYEYIDEHGAVVYVGQGLAGRAWHCGYMKGDTQERKDWKDEQIEKGRLPCDWVVIVERGLTKSAAREREILLIRELQPFLNKHHTDHYTPSYKKWTESQTEESILLRENGLSYRQIAENFGVATMTVWRNLNAQ